MGQDSDTPQSRRGQIRLYQCLAHILARTEFKHRNNMYCDSSKSIAITVDVPGLPLINKLLGSQADWLEPFLANDLA